MRRPIFCFVLIVLTVCGYGLNAKADSHTAGAVVAEFQAALVEVMKVAENTSVSERFERLQPSVEKAFHIPLMAQMATGRYWNQGSRNEKIGVIDAFRRMSISTLATLFDGYSGERFTVKRESPGPQKTTIVRTVLTKSDKSTINIDYVARKFSGKWRLIDVIIDNKITELTTRIDEYKPTLKKSGLQGLITLLNGTADKLMSE